MRRLLVLRSGAETGGDFGEDVDVVTTHEIAPAPGGVAEARSFDPAGATLIVSSRSTVDVLSRAGVALAGFLRTFAAGAETARSLAAAGVGAADVPRVPGAAGILALLPERLDGCRILWPRAADAAVEPFDELARRGARVTAPVVYTKRSRPLDPALAARFSGGEYAGVAVGSLAALVVLLEAVPCPPPVRWGVLGPETARALVARGFREPLMPDRPRLSDLVDLLRSETE